MSDASSFDFSSAVAMLVVVVVMLAVIIHLTPALIQIAWQVLPGLLVLCLILSVLRCMVKKLLG